ncbi:hypothetical protein DL95DRAFT_461413 [Leptodontidium sp. 2 PMI_412]|nr:hypothetical protein DL95DRAFT_461413 [Leptodontidium sp. 2 PMI_412]
MSNNDGFAIALSKGTIKTIKTQQRNKPFRFLDLPREIRDLIYHHCFVRPIGISPAFNYGRRRLPKKERGGGKAWYKYSVYKCQWDGRRQFIPIANDKYDKKTPVDGEVEDMTMYWTSAPTPAQELLLMNEIYDLPDTEVNEAEGIYTKIKHRANKRHGDVIEIINTQERTIAGLVGIGLLRTNQQVYNEATKILYGNTFVINTAVAHSATNLDTDRHLYPGFPNKNGNPATAKDNSRRIHKFLNKGRQPSFSKYDPLLMFLRTIGPHCASLIQSVKINGEFKTVSNGSPVNTLTLARTWGTNRVYNSPADEFESKEWGWAVEDDREDDERISEIVEKVAKGLPSLKGLQLGNFFVPWISPGEDSEDKVKDPWGVAVKWSAFIKDRERERGSEVLKRIRAGETVEQAAIRDRLFKLGPGQTGGEADQERRLQLNRVQQQRNAEPISAQVGQTLQISTKSQISEKRIKIKTQHRRKFLKIQVLAPSKPAPKYQNPFALLMGDDEDDGDD